MRATDSQELKKTTDAIPASCFEPDLSIDFRKVKSLYDIKDIEALFKKVRFVLEHLDKSRFLQFRAGKLTLP